MTPSDAVEHLTSMVLDWMNDELGDEWYTGIQRVSEALGIPREIARAVLRVLRQRGLVAYKSGLWTEDGEMAGAGYGITKAGRDLCREQTPTQTGTAEVNIWDGPTRDVHPELK